MIPLLVIFFRSLFKYFILQKMIYSHGSNPKSTEGVHIVKKNYLLPLSPSYPVFLLEATLLLLGYNSGNNLYRDKQICLCFLKNTNGKIVYILGPLLSHTLYHEDCFILSIKHFFILYGYIGSHWVDILSFV